MDLTVIRGRKRKNERTSSLPQAKRSPLNERCSEYQSGKGFIIKINFNFKTKLKKQVKLISTETKLGCYLSNKF